ncbi:MAG: glutamate racemase [Nitrososphaerales archaeon]
MDNRPIAVFDSGIGSLSLIKSLRKEMPNESIVYLADRVHYPYGKKTQEQLKSIIIKTFKCLEKFDPKAIIVASVTPSMQVLKECKLHTNVPVFGVYLNIGEAVAMSKTRFIALLATEGIIGSERLDDYTKPYITTTKIIKVNASPLIDIVESGKFLDDKTTKAFIANNTLDIKSNPQIDVIILGSTHLQVLKGHLASFYPKVQFVDPAINTVEQVKTYLQYQEISAQNKGSVRILVSKNRPQFEKIVRSIGIQDRIEDIKFDFNIDVF